mgnify:CR=1 FL=1
MLYKQHSVHVVFIEFPLVILYIKALFMTTPSHELWGAFIVKLVIFVKFRDILNYWKFHRSTIDG